MPTLTIPQRTGRREQARQLISGLPSDLSGQTVEIDFADDVRTTPSFIDEIVTVLVRDRGAATVRLVGLTPDLVRLVQQVGDDLDVVERLVCE